MRIWKETYQNYLGIYGKSINLDLKKLKSQQPEKLGNNQKYQEKLKIVATCNTDLRLRGIEFG
jgi:hypothetical protein